MLKKISITVFINILISMQILIAQNSNCSIPEKIAKGKLTMEVADNKLTSGAEVVVVTYFKMAAKSNEVNEVDWINCEGFMPNGAKISSIEILEVEGLPDGLNWYCDKEDCVYNGAETGCVTIEGIASKKGTYPLTVTLKGVGGIFGIKKSYDCLIKTLDIVVE